MDAVRNCHREPADYRQHRDLQREEGSRETGQQIQRRLLPGIKGAERLQVKDTPRRSRAGRAPGQERRERLAGLGVARQPVVGAGPGNRVESLLVERALKRGRQPGDRA